MREGTPRSRTAASLLVAVCLGGSAMVTGQSPHARTGSVHECDSATEHGITPLMRAAFQARAVEVDRLLAAGADPDQRCHEEGTTALLMTLGPLVMPDQFQARQADIPFDLPPDPGSPEDRAARERILDALLTAGADPNWSEGRTYPLAAALMSRSDQAVAALLAHGADPDLVPNLGQLLRLADNPKIREMLRRE